MPIARRRFLQVGLLGSVLLSGAGLAVWPSRLRFRARERLYVLDEREFAVLAAIASRTVTAPGADPVTIAHRLDASLYLQVPEAQHDYRQLLVLFENALAGVLLDGRFRPFTRLEPAEQDAVLRAWRDSRITLRRNAYTVLRKMTTAMHYGGPESWASVDYVGPPSLPT